MVRIPIACSAQHPPPSCCPSALLMELSSFGSMSEELLGKVSTIYIIFFPLTHLLLTNAILSKKVIIIFLKSLFFSFFLKRLHHLKKFSTNGGIFIRCGFEMFHKISEETSFCVNHFSFWWLKKVIVKFQMLRYVLWRLEYQGPCLQAPGRIREHGHNRRDESAAR